MNRLITLAVLAVVATPIAPLSALLAFDWRANEQGIYDGQTVDREDSDYYPLKVGNTWTYTVAGNKFVLKVVKYQQVGAQRCAKVEMQDNNGKALSYEHVTVKRDGVYRVSFEGNKTDPPVKFLALPLNAGAHWKVNSTVGKEKLAGTFQVGKFEKLKVADKQYDVMSVRCGDLDANGVKVDFTVYYARNVGMVKQIIKIGGQEVVLELEKFEPAK